PALLYAPLDRARHIVLPRLVQVGKLRRLAPRQRHVVRAAAARHPGDERRGDVGLELSRRDVVEQRERPRPVHQDVVHAVIHEILTYGLVDPGPAGPSTSKWTSCLNACTRARTAAGVTLSNPWIPNASTANDPMAAPYTIARRRFGAERSPFRARWAMKPPANASPAPVGS